MPEESKDNINKIVMLFLAALMGITLQGMVNKNTKLENAASKDDVEAVEIKVTKHSDKNLEKANKHTDELMLAHEKTEAIERAAIFTILNNIQEDVRYIRKNQ